MKYLEFLKKVFDKIAALGPKAEELMNEFETLAQQFEQVVRTLGNISAILHGRSAEAVPALASAAPLFEATSEEASLEDQIYALSASSSQRSRARGTERGNILRKLWTFIQAHPELLNVIWKLLLD